MAREFIASNLQYRMSGTLEATDWLNERLVELKKTLRESERALQDFRDREQLVDIEGVTGPGGDELRNLAQRLDEARKARIETMTIKEELDSLSENSLEAYLSIPAILDHAVIRSLRGEQTRAERRVAELSKRYGVKHPKRIAAQSELDTVNEELAAEVRKVVSGIGRAHDLAVRNEEEVLRAWESRKSEVQDFNRKEFELMELQRDVETNRQLYEIFFTRLKSISETGGFERPHARIVDKAQIPRKPVSPNMRSSLIISLFFSLVLACFGAVVLEALDNTVKLPEEVANLLGVPLLGSIPLLETDKDGNFEQYWENQTSEYAEAIRTLRTAVVLSGLDRPAQVILVTSSVPDEGKSTTALNLGSALAQMESTLVIGADLRRPNLARKCGLDQNHLGLSHYVSGTAELEDCIVFLEDSGMHVMPAGIVPPNPLEMISSKKFVGALSVLKERFERIVIDSAPVEAVSDALMLASYADFVVYLVKADDTAATLAAKGVQRVLASNEPLTGVVLTHVDSAKTARYYRAGHYQYGNYYQSAAGES